MIRFAIIAPPREPHAFASTTRIIRLPKPDPVTGNTDDQVMATLGIMRGLVRDAQRWNSIQRLSKTSVPAYDLCRRITFKRDPKTAEAIRHPELIARAIEQGAQPAGDCDDVATFGASILLARGRTPVFVVMARRAGAPFEHVYFGETSRAGRDNDPTGLPILASVVVPYDPQEGTQPGKWTPPGLSGGRLECWPAW